MRRSIIIIISILAMLILAGSLMGFVANISVDTNRDGNAYIEIVGGGQTQRIPVGSGTFTIDDNSNNTHQSQYLNPYYGYTATVYAYRVVNGVTITDTDSQNFTYGTATFTLTVDLSGNGGIPDDPPMQD
ncbi:MAG: hypothetical protein K9N07_03805 [Candidatus Cloacimonetes bacterium]|nr:hypothetical protein [Candidatus Cloacimonadota bacterium]